MTEVMDSFVSGSENLSRGPDVYPQHTPESLTHGAANIEKQLQTPADITSARNFFAAKVDLQPVVGQPAPGIEQTGAAALKALSEPISPLLQIIMRMPGHIGIFNSFFEALKSFFLPNTDFLSHFNLVNLASGVDLSFIQDSLQGLPGQFSDITGGAHLHVDSWTSLKQSMNVSAGIDLQHPQFEGMSQTDSPSYSSLESANGTHLAGPSISEAITTHLSPAQRIFSHRLFETGNVARVSTAAVNPSTMSGGTSNTMAFNQGNVSSPTSSASAISALDTNSTEFNGSETLSGNHTIGSQPTLSGMHAKALSLNSVLHKGTDIQHKLATNPFAKLAAKNHTHQISHTDKTFSSHHSTLPHTTGTSHTDTSHTESASSSQYTVKTGDSLWRISEKTYGSGSNWAELYKLNRQIVGTDPNLILPGQKLNLSTSTGHEMVAMHQHLPKPTHPSIPQTPHQTHHTVERLVQKNPTANHVLAHGLKVEQSHDQLLSGAGGAQAANVPPIVKEKSVVSFSLTPDLSFLKSDK